jgi:hypothetical protein
MSKRASMVALALSVLALSGGLASGETPSVGLLQCQAADTPISSVAPSRPALAVAMLNDGQLRDEPGSVFERLSFEITNAPTRDTVTFGTAVSFSEASEPIEMLLAAPMKFFDVGFAQRTVSTEYRGAYVTGQGAEVRVGQGLALRQSNGAASSRNGWYLFAASDGRQLSWTPASDPAAPTRTLRLDQGVEIGDLQLGLAAQRGHVQTSLSVVKRTVKSYFGPFKTSADDSFAGLTLSWRN